MVMKQTTASKSSSEAEYRASQQLLITCELQWQSYLLKDLQAPLTPPASLYCDNHSVIHLAHNPTFYFRTKYIEIDRHIICEKINTGLVHLLPVSSIVQLERGCYQYIVVLIIIGQLVLFFLFYISVSQETDLYYELSSLYMQDHESACN